MTGKLADKVQMTDSAWPIYKRVAEALRQEIVCGRIDYGERLPTEAALAAELGINHQTLRKSLKILTEQRLITQCQGRGTFACYQMEERLKIGAVISRHEGLYSNDIYMLRMIVGLSRALMEAFRGELVIIECSSADEVMEKANQSQCDALIVLSPDVQINAGLCAPAFDHLPVVFINSGVKDLEKFNRFEVKTARGMIGQSIKYLYGLGHRKIGYISLNRDNNYDLQRINEEFTEVFRQYGLSPEYSLIGNVLGWFDYGRAGIHELFGRQDRPTALLFPSYYVSCGAWQGLMDLGVKVPADVSFLGFGMNQSVYPDISSVNQPLPQLCEKAVELVFDLRNKGKHLKKKCYEIEAELSIKSSCAPLDSTKPL